MARPQQSTTLTIATSLGRGLAGICKWIWRVVRGPSDSKKLNQAALLADWQQIQALADSNDSVRLVQAVQQADRFFDHVMKLTGARGSSFAERLRSQESRFDSGTYQAAWAAHKLRNELAHQHGTSVTASDANRALGQFRSAARDLGAF